MPTQKLKLVFWTLFILLIIVGAFYWYEVLSFDKRLHSSFLEQKRLSFPYFVKAGEGLEYTLLLGDLDGLNRNSFLRLLSLAQNPTSDSVRDSIIIVPSLMPEKSLMLASGLDQESLYNQISNGKGVVLVDNFCTKGWGEFKLKSIYKVTSLTPGPFCFSEPETRDLNTLIKMYRIKNIKIVYDVAGYENFIDNFLEFLKENNIAYSFVQSGNASLNF